MSGIRLSHNRTGIRKGVKVTSDSFLTFFISKSAREAPPCIGTKPAKDFGASGMRVVALCTLSDQLYLHPAALNGY